MSDPSIPPTPPPGAPKEPLVGVAAITALVIAGLALFVSFGLNISNDQQSAILGIIAPLAVVATALWSRVRVYSPATVRAMLLRLRDEKPADRMQYTSPPNDRPAGRRQYGDPV